MAQPYIPATNAAFDAWLVNFSTLITATPATYGLVSGDAVLIATQKTAFHAAYLAATTPATRTPVTVAAMAAARATAEAVVRPYAVAISLNGGVANDDKVAVGVTVRKTIPTPVPPPITTPTLSLVAGTPLTHQLAYRDTSTPTSKAKPFGATGIQISRKIGVTAETDPDNAPFYDIWTKSPNNSSFLSPDIGKLATYFARWTTKSGPGGSIQYGPWSAALTIAIL